MTGRVESLVQDESLPLLIDQRHDVEQTSQQRLNGPSSVSPLPKAQLATLCLIRLMDPIAYCQIFPYINEFISYLHITDDPSQIGFYSGLVESSFAVAQLCSIYQWTRLSNTIGRRPVVMMGTLGVAIATAWFGFSTSLTEIILSRCLAGIFAGTVAVIHSILAEITDSTNQSVAFPIYGLFWPLGAILGPLLGGSLSNPAAKYPHLFANTIFSVYPYLLPCTVACTLSLCGVILCYTCLKETLPSKQLPSDKDDPSKVSGSEDEEPPKLGVQALLSIPFMRALSLSSFALSFNGTAFDVLFVLFCYSPIKNGGLGFSASQIGFSLASAGAASALMQLFFMPSVLRRYNRAAIYNFCVGFWPIVFAALPVLNVIARCGLNASSGELDGHSASLLWVGVIVILATSRIACLAYSVNMVLIKENTPNPMVLASVNGLIQCFMCLSRAISPTVVSCVFALSEEHHVLGGYFWSLFMVICTLAGCSLAKGISQGNDASKPRPNATYGATEHCG
ncbi:major facilitator superfamily multidrug- dha1 sub-family [Moniliophthora roreri MCA 2997]|uniref:Major facilitator superfamily multidrug-dha1 sub-family n=2 Tax=Moniliophthora roreri TaxID=221103 RepID=V2XK17_MONRO|nr:major facilitator superfamily multidrug- dha1 sub-family [Moniliophthora roreri MCA 2997]KAI3607748.1 major facilitator superfamily multidrug-dha1 sub-family [Moniliophthora roreri]